MTLALMPVMAMSETWAMAWPSHTGGLPQYCLKIFYLGNQIGNNAIIAGVIGISRSARNILK